MNKFKKLYALILSAALIFSLSSCGNKNAETESNDTSSGSISAEATENVTDKTVTENEKDDTSDPTEKEVTSSSAKSETGSVSTTVKATKAAESKNIRIKNLYIEALNNNKYEISELNPSQTHPTYSLFDFDKDGIPELLIWEVRLGSFMNRNISVYKYNSQYDKVDYMGEMTVLSGHSEFGKALDKSGIVIATRDSGTDTITEYSIKNGKIVPTVLLERADENDSDWLNIITSSKYSVPFELDQYCEDKDLDAYFK